MLTEVFFRACSTMGSDRQHRSFANRVLIFTPDSCKQTL